MLRTITELVPFGQDARAREISCYYLANCGHSLGGGYDYFIGFYEKPSQFSNYEGVRKFKRIQSYDRNASNFDMTLAIFSPEGWLDFDQVIKNSDNEKIIEIFDKRAMEDIGWNSKGSV